MDEDGGAACVGEARAQALAGVCRPPEAPGLGRNKAGGAGDFAGVEATFMADPASSPADMASTSKTSASFGSFFPLLERTLACSFAAILVALRNLTQASRSDFDVRSRMHLSSHRSQGLFASSSNSSTVLFVCWT